MTHPVSYFPLCYSVGFLILRLRYYSQLPYNFFPGIRQSYPQVRGALMLDLITEWRLAKQFDGVEGDGDDDGVRGDEVVQMIV